MLDIINKALRYAENFSDYAEVRVEDSDNNKIIFKNGNVEIVDSTRTIGLCIRILKDGALAAAFTNGFTLSKIKRATINAVKMAKASKKLKKSITLSDEKPNKERYKVKEKIKIRDVSLEEKIKELIELDKDLLATKLNVPARLFELSNEIREKYYINSDGSFIHSKIPRVGLEYLITLVSNGLSQQRMFQLGGSGGWEIFRDWNLNERIVNEAKMLSKISKAQKSPRGKFNVILSPELIGIASHESCGHPYEADRILGREAAQAGESFITRQMLGKRIGSEIVNLVDDPTVKGSYGFYLYDDEGIKAQRRFLIKNGKINTFLHNRETASEFGVKSNAASRSSNWSFEPIVRMANTFVLPGDHKFEELIEVKRGVYIKSYMEWNIDDKRFNQRYVGLEAYLVKNGKIENLIKRPVIEITTPTFWQSVDAIGKDLGFTAGTCGKSEPMQGVPVWFGGPHIRLKNIRLG